MQSIYNPLSAVSPVDGRYHSKTKSLSHYFSEYALIRYRVQVEIEYLIALSELALPSFKKISEKNILNLRKIYETFSYADAELIKQKESITNHDVKAVEYFIKEKLDALGLGINKEFVHFGLTSQDINNTAVPMSIRDYFTSIGIPEIEKMISELLRMAKEWDKVPMIARTHGQPATPTRLGKEIHVFAERLQTQLRMLKAIPHSGKFGGATGNLNAHYIAYPNIDWISFSNQFLKNKLGIERQRFTTQIEHYDTMAALFDTQKRINTILIDFCRDIWSYISIDYFKQKILKNEIGSSAMPHKVNPIDFENAEGNLGVANALFEHLSSKLPVSRLQRDLTDSTVSRTIGVPFAHTAIAMASIQKGLSKLLLNQAAIDADLETNCIVVAEAIQTILRREGYPNPYEKLKDLTRTNERITMKHIHAFIDSLEISAALKANLKKITPHTYTGKNK